MHATQAAEPSEGDRLRLEPRSAMIATLHEMTRPWGSTICRSPGSRGIRSSADRRPSSDRSASTSIRGGAKRWGQARSSASVRFGACSLRQPRHLPAPAAACGRPRPRVRRGHPAERGAPRSRRLWPWPQGAPERRHSGVVRAGAGGRAGHRPALRIEGVIPERAHEPVALLPQGAACLGFSSGNLESASP